MYVPVLEFLFLLRTFFASVETVSSVVSGGVSSLVGVVVSRSSPAAAFDEALLLFFLPLPLFPLRFLPLRLPPALPFLAWAAPSSNPSAASSASPAAPREAKTSRRSPGRAKIARDASSGAGSAPTVVGTVVGSLLGIEDEFLSGSNASDPSR
jgi:hypothetical protein